MQRMFANLNGMKLEINEEKDFWKTLKYLESGKAEMARKMIKYFNASENTSCCESRADTVKGLKSTISASTGRNYKTKSKWKQKQQNKRRQWK